MALTFTPQPTDSEVFPKFSLNSVNGKKYSSQDFLKNKPIVVMFICNHCPYVKAIEDRLIQLGKDLKEKQIPVIAICSNDSSEYPEDSLENLKARSQEKNYPFIYLHDADQKIAHLFGAVCTPDFFVYDKSGKLAYRARLDDNWKDATKVTKRELYEAVLLLEQDKPVPTTTIPSMGCSIKWL